MLNDNTFNCLNCGALKALLVPLQLSGKNLHKIGHLKHVPADRTRLLLRRHLQWHWEKDHQNVIIYDPHLFEYVTEFYRIIPDRCLDEIRQSRRYATRDAAEECKHWRSVIGMGTLPHKGAINQTKAKNGKKLEDYSGVASGRALLLSKSK